MTSQRERREWRAHSEKEKTPAPVHTLQAREVFAVEHPMIIENLDKALKTFGTNRPFRRILDSGDPDECLPLYLRPHDPMSVPILSHNGATTNVLLQITVPKRTGRKRKRGSQDPYIDHNVAVEENIQPIPPPPPNKLMIPYHGESVLPTDQQNTIASQARRDDPVTLKRIMKDNIGRYTFEPVGRIKRTHRFRGMSDFQQSTNHGGLIPRLKETVLTGNISKMHNFQLDTSMGAKPQGEVLPPPSFTHHSIPFNWAWQQNPNIFIETDDETGQKIMVNHSANVLHTARYLPRDAPVIPKRGPPNPPTDKPIIALVAALREAFEERPLWTRRGLMNRIGHFPSFYLLRNAIPYVGYMFKGGPFRDSIIKYGIDPRTDPKYRKYQVFFFKLFTKDSTNIAGSGDPWEEMRPSVAKPYPGEGQVKKDTHLFDGKNLVLDGKIWQVCDITDPLLKSLIDTAPYPSSCDNTADGWFTNGRLAKIKAIMKVKLIAIRTNKTVKDDDFAIALGMEDIYPDKTNRNIYVPTPDLRLTEEEIAELEAKGVDLKGMGIGALKQRITKDFAKRARKMGVAGEKRGRYKRKKKGEMMREVPGVPSVDERLGLQIQPPPRARGGQAGVKRGPYREKGTVDALLAKAKGERRKKMFEEKKVWKLERELVRGGVEEGGDLRDRLSSPEADEGEGEDDDDDDGEEESRQIRAGEREDGSDEDDTSDDGDEDEEEEGEEPDNADPDSDETEDADFTPLPRAAAVALIQSSPSASQQKSQIVR